MKNKPFIFKNLKFAGILTAASIGSLAVASGADAALLFSDTASFTNQLTELNGGPVLTLSKYNPGSGFNVDRVVVSLSGSLRSSGSVTNTAAQAQTFTASTRVAQYDFTPGAGAPDVLQTLQPFSSLALIGSKRYTNLAPNTPSGFGPFTINGSDSDTYLGSDIAGFLGTGTLTINPFTEILTAFQGGGGNVANSIQTVADATLTIEYYGEQQITPPPSPASTTPEPSIVLGLGTLSLLGLFNKNRNSNS